MKPTPDPNASEFSLFCKAHTSTDKSKANLEDAPPVSPIYHDKFQRLYANNPDSEQIMHQDIKGNNVPLDNSDLPNESKVYCNMNQQQSANQQMENPYLESKQQSLVTPIDTPQKPQEPQHVRPQYYHSTFLNQYNNNENQSTIQSYSSGEFKINETLDCFYQGMSSPYNNFQNNYSMNNNIPNYNNYDNQIAYTNNMLPINNNQPNKQYCPYCNKTGIGQFNTKCSCMVNNNNNNYNYNRGVWENSNWLNTLPPQYDSHNYYHSGSFSTR